MRDILKSFLDEFYIVKDGNCFVLFPFEYTPFTETRLDSYYLASHQCHLLSRQIVKALNEGGFYATTKVHAPLKKLAVSVNMGFLGQNGLVYHKKYGSRLVIGAIEVQQTNEVKEIALDPVIFDKPQFMSQCSDCNACIKACPQGALLGNGVLDTTKCTRALMDKGFVDDDLVAQRFGARVLGCDICQRVCKVNGNKMQKMPDICNRALDDVLIDNNNSLLCDLIGKNMAKKKVIKRLVIIEAGNSKRKQLLPYIERLVHDPDFAQNAKRAKQQLQ